MLLPNYPPHDKGSSDETMDRSPDTQIIIGIVSYANYSFTNETGVVCILINGIQDWIYNHIFPQVLAISTPSIH